MSALSRRAHVVTVASADEARVLVQGPLPSRVEIVPQLLAADAAAEWQARLNRELSACGCQQSAFAMLAVLPVAMVYAVWGLPDAPWWARLGVVVAAAFVATGVVKGVVIVRARRRYRSLTTRLFEQLTSGAEAAHGQL